MRPPNPVVSPVRTRRFRSLTALDALDFFQADVHGGVGPFFVTFLATSLHWTPDRIGTVIFASRIAGLCAQAPIGAIVDKFKAKGADYCNFQRADCPCLHRHCQGAELSCDSAWPTLYHGSRCLFRSAWLVEPG
jgi:hypothetical protein